MVGTIQLQIRTPLTCLEMLLLRLTIQISLLVLSKLRTKIFKCYIGTKGLTDKQEIQKIKVTKCNKDTAIT